MRIIGLTGGIACGKSTVARMFAELGVPVIDADQLAREVVQPGRPAHAEILREFGADFADATGALDRKRLGALVFADKGLRLRLEAITHPRIAEAARVLAAAHAAAGAPFVLYEAALLVERRLHEALDGLIVVSLSPVLQAARVAARDGLDDDAVRARLAAQLPLAAKLAAATQVIDNSGSQDETRQQVERVWRELAAAVASPGSHDAP
ncbi:MAG: dephospho-CoA kinase [Myxococcales bacterium]|nr:dephospho-CoA kinase [Myxococcales bacterium]